MYVWVGHGVGAILVKMHQIVFDCSAFFVFGELPKTLKWSFLATITIGYLLFFAFGGDYLIDISSSTYLKDDLFVIMSLRP